MTYPTHGTWLSTTEFGFCVTFIILCPIFVGLRLWSRIISAERRVHTFTLSDVLVVVGCVATLGNTVCDIIETVYGDSGRHITSAMDTGTIAALKTTFVAAFFWISATCALKVSLLLLYKELFTSRILTIAAYSLIGLISAFFAAFFVTFLCECSPMSHIWVKAEPGTCIDTIAETQAGIFINLIFDLTITVLPISTVWRLQMPIRKRLTIIFIFSLGLCADGVAIARAITFGKWYNDPDMPYVGGKENILSAMELWLGTIVACIPCLKPALSVANTGVTKLISAKESNRSRGAAAHHSDSGIMHTASNRSIDLEDSVSPATQSEYVYNGVAF